MGLLGFALRIGGAAVALCLSTPSPAQIHVNLYNHVGVARQVVNEARRDADRILLSAGVRLTWSDCNPSESDADSCVFAGPATLLLRLYPTAAEGRFPVDPKAFGFALSQPPPNQGYYVGVFYHRVEALALRDHIRAGPLLGHVIAHEIGHLLLWGGGHAADGIMKFPWRRKDLGLLQRGMLLFHLRQRKIIMGNVAARLSVAKPAID